MRKQLWTVFLVIFSVLVGSPNLIPATADGPTYVATPAPPWVSSLDQGDLPYNLFGADQNYWHLSDAGAGIKVYILASSTSGSYSDHVCDQARLLESYVLSVAPSAIPVVYETGRCTDDTTTRDGFSYDFSDQPNHVVDNIRRAILDNPPNKKAILILAAENNNPAETQIALRDATNDGIVVVTDSLTQLECTNRNFIAVGRNFGTYADGSYQSNLGERSRDERCIDIFAPAFQPSPSYNTWYTSFTQVASTAGALAILASANPSSSPLQLKQLLFSYAETSTNVKGCQYVCEKRSLDLADFLSNGAPLRRGSISSSLNDSTGAPIRGTTLTFTGTTWTNWSPSSVSVEWFFCEGTGNWDHKGIDFTQCGIVGRGPTLITRMDTCGTCQVWLVETFHGAGSDRITAVGPTSNFKDAPYLSGYPNVFQQVRVVDNLDSGSTYRWLLCLTETLVTNTQPSGCKPVGTANKDLQITREMLGGHIVSEITGVNRIYTKSTARIKKESRSVSITALSEKNIGARTTVSVDISNNLGPCPKSIKMQIRDAATGRITYSNVSLSNCEGSLKVTVRSNTRLSVDLPENSSSEGAKASARILATPWLLAVAPKRAYDRYRLTIKSQVAQARTCGLIEDYYTFAGEKFATRSTSFRLNSYQTSFTRKPAYVGVIKGLVTCSSSSKYGSSADTFKVFSY